MLIFIKVFCVVVMLLYFVFLLAWHYRQRQRSKSARYFFALYVLNLLIIADILFTHQFTILYDWWVFPTLPVCFFFAPAFYKYVLAYINPNHKEARKVNILLWLPGILHTFFIIGTGIWASGQHLSLAERLQHKYNPIYMRVELFSAFAFSFAIIFFTYKKSNCV